MGKYVQSNLNKNETLVAEIKLSPWPLIGKWIVGILFFWLLLIPFIKAIIFTIKYKSNELVVTNKRVVGKSGFVAAGSLDAPLNKIQNVAVLHKFWGKIFNYGYIEVSTAAGKFFWTGVKNADTFKNIIMSQIDQYEEDRIKQQAAEMAQAMAGVLNK